MTAALGRMLVAQDRWMRGIFRRLAIVLGAAVYSVILVTVYRFDLSPIYAYMGAIDRHPPMWALICAMGIGIVPSLFLPLELDRPSVIVEWIFYLMTFIPISFMPLMILDRPLGQIFFFNGFILMAFFLLHVLTRTPLVDIPGLRVDGWSLIVLFAAFSYAFVAYKFGLSFRMVHFLDTYIVRAEFAEASRNAGRFASYFIFWLSNVVNPIFIVRGLIRRSFWLVVVGLVGQFMIYSITAFKAVFVSWAFIAGAYVLIRRWKPHFALRFIWASTVVVALLCSTKFTRALFIFRSVDTGMETSWYFDYFSDHPRAHLGDSFLSRFVTYPYDLDVPHLIGSVYLNNRESDANANVFADAYANFGYPGVLIWTVAWGAVLWLYDSIARHKDRLMTTLLLIIPSIAVANAPLQTTLLTHGLALMMLFIYLLPSGDAEPAKGRSWLRMLFFRPERAA